MFRLLKQKKKREQKLETWQWWKCLWDRFVSSCCVFNWTAFLHCAVAQWDGSFSWFSFKMTCLVVYSTYVLVFTTSHFNQLVMNFPPSFTASNLSLTMALSAVTERLQVRWGEVKLQLWIKWNLNGSPLLLAELFITCSYLRMRPDLR